MSAAESPLGDYDLEDPEVLRVAVELAPELFAALEISRRVTTFPISSDDEIEQALLEVADDQERYEGSGVSIGREEARDRFPNEFLPVADRFDLLRKVYMAIIIAHESEARRRIGLAKRGEYEVQASHPFEVGDL